MIIIIPSIRNINLVYLKPLLNKGNRIFVVDDTDEERIEVNSKEVTVIHYSDKKRILGKLEACIPNKNGVCRDMGLVAAYHCASDDDTIVCLDDDCQVFDDYQKKAENSLGIKYLPELKTSNRFYNPLDLYNHDYEIFPRGFPYEERGKKKDYKYNGKVKTNIVFNLGLWNGVFDVNAVDKLYLEKFSFDNLTLKYPQVLVQKGPLVSLCSMNMIMKREVIPAIYQVPMNQPVIPNWKIDRYGDIWGGYICKKLIDIKGDGLSIGEPLIYHHKDSNLHKNILQEHYAHIVNMQFCNFLDIVCKQIHKADYLNMYEQLTQILDKRKQDCPEALKTYLYPTIEKMKLWVKALKLDHFNI